MKKTDKSSAKKDSNAQPGFSRSDKLALIKEIHHMMSNFDYVSVNMFKESAERVSAAFLRGRSASLVVAGGDLRRAARLLAGRIFVHLAHRLGALRMDIVNRAGHR